MTTATLFPSERLLDEAREARLIGNTSLAEAKYKQAIEDRIKVLGEANGSVGAYIHELGSFQLSSGNYDSADTTLKKALEVTQAAYYAGHSTLAFILDDIADLYLKQDKLAEAEPILVRQLDICDKTMNGDHRMIFETLHKLAYVHRKLGKTAEAEKLLLKALKTIDTPLGPAEEFKFDLALLYDEMGKTSEADTNFRQAALGFEQRSNHARLADVLSAYAGFLKKTGKNDKARKIQEAAESIKKTHGSEHSCDLFTATLMRA